MSALLVLLSRHDERFLHALVVRRRTLPSRVMRSVTHIGDAWVVVALAVALSLGAVPGLERAGYEAAFVLVVSHLGVQLLKRTISRPRPRLPVGCASLIEAPDCFSFPSGHAAASLSLALPLSMALPGLFGAFLLGLAALVGVSRCYLGVHYPGDVLMGWLLAGITALVAGPAVGWMLA